MKAQDTTQALRKAAKSTKSSGIQPENTGFSRQAALTFTEGKGRFSENLKFHIKYWRH